MNGEKFFCAKPVKQGIIRISKYENMPKNYLERYGIVTIPNSESVDGVTADSNSITLPNGRILEFDVRPDGDAVTGKTRCTISLKSSEIKYRLS